MFFSFRLHKDKNKDAQSEDKLNEIMDGEYKLLEKDEICQEPNGENDLIAEDITIVDLDQEHEEGKLQLPEAYKKIGLEEYPATEARVKQAYYEKRQEIREYHLSGEGRLLFELKKAYELIISYPDEFLQQDGEESTKSIEAEPDTIEEMPNEELFLWDDVMDEIDSEYKQKRNRKRTRAAALIVIVVSAIVLTVIGWIETNHVKECETVLSNEKIISYLSLEPIELDYEQKLIISEEDISQCEKKNYIHIPIIHIYMQETEYLVQINDAEIIVSSLLLLKYNQGNNNKLEYTLLKNIPLKTKVNISLVGTWSGSYKASAESNATSNLVIELIENESGAITGVCEIEADNGKKGSHYVSVTTMPGALETSIKGTEWINKPAFFIMSELEAYYDIQSKSLLPTNKSGPVFLLTREK